MDESGGPNRDEDGCFSSYSIFCFHLVACANISHEKILEQNSFVGPLGRESPKPPFPPPS